MFSFDTVLFSNAHVSHQQPYVRRCVSSSPPWLNCLAYLVRLSINRRIAQHLPPNSTDKASPLSSSANRFSSFASRYTSNNNDLLLSPFTTIGSTSVSTSKNASHASSFVRPGRKKILASAQCPVVLFSRCLLASWTVAWLKGTACSLTLSN